jgi:hypothetical protein
MGDGAAICARYEAPMRFAWFILFATVPLVAAPLSACGGNDASEPQSSLDAGSADATSADVQALDAIAPPPHDAGAPPPPDARAPSACPPSDSGGIAPAAPALSLIVADPNALPEAITTDNQVVYVSNGATSVAPLDGSAPPQLLAPAVDGGFPPAALASGPNVLLQGSGLSVWSKERGMRLVTSSSTPFMAGSDDGAWIAYVVVDSGATAHLVVEASDGSSSTTVASGLLAMREIVLQFAGDTLVAQYSDASNEATDAGVAATLTAFAPPSFAPAILTGQVQAVVGHYAPPTWTVDPTGARVWAPLARPPENGELFTLASPGTPAVVDTGAGMGIFSPPGDALYYTTNSGAVKRIATSAPSSPVAVASSAESVLDVSPDGKYVTYSTAASQPYDLYIASADAPGAPVVEDATKNIEDGSNMFTADSQFLVYRADTSSSSTILFAPVSCGAPTVLTGNQASYAYPMYGSVVLVADNSTFEVNDFSLYDLRAPTLKTTLARSVASSVLFPPGGKTFIYSSQTQVAPGVGPGLILATLQ